MLTDADLEAVDARLAAEAGALMHQITALEAQGNDFTRALIGIRHSRATLAELRSTLAATPQNGEADGKTGDLPGEGTEPSER